MKGNVVGTHDGAALYTIGQRHGFSVRTSKGATATHYVVEIDAAANTVRVSEHKHDAAKDSVVLEDIHWIGEAPQLPFQASVEVRYHSTPVRARIESSGNGVRAIFHEPQIVSPGQSLVIYDGTSGKQCRGGGVMGL